MHQQIQRLSDMLKKSDPALWDHLEREGCGNMFFTFRWLLVLFKREFSFAAIPKLWEVCWSRYLCEDFHLYFALALLTVSRTKVLQEKLAFDEILKFMQECSATVTLDTLLWRAEILFWKHSTAPIKEK